MPTRASASALTRRPTRLLLGDYRKSVELYGQWQDIASRATATEGQGDIFFTPIPSAVKKPLAIVGSGVSFRPTRSAA
jgi:hypothetical protein